jgi:hypothetical protein
MGFIDAALVLSSPIGPPRSILGLLHVVQRKNSLLAELGILLEIGYGARSIFHNAVESWRRRTIGDH